MSASLVLNTHSPNTTVAVYDVDELYGGMHYLDSFEVGNMQDAGMEVRIDLTGSIKNWVKKQKLRGKMIKVSTVGGVRKHRQATVIRTNSIKEWGYCSLVFTDFAFRPKVTVSIEKLDYTVPKWLFGCDQSYSNLAKSANTTDTVILQIQILSPTPPSLRLSDSILSPPHLEISVFQSNLPDSKCSSGCCVVPFYVNFTEIGKSSGMCKCALLSHFQVGTIGF